MKICIFILFCKNYVKKFLENFPVEGCTISVYLLCFMMLRSKFFFKKKKHPEQNWFNLFQYLFLNDIQWSRESLRNSPDLVLLKGIFLFRKTVMYTLWECNNWSLKHISKKVKIIQIEYLFTHIYLFTWTVKELKGIVVFIVSVYPNPNKQPGDPETITSEIGKKIFL